MRIERVTKIGDCGVSAMYVYVCGWKIGVGVWKGHQRRVRLTLIRNHRARNIGSLWYEWDAGAERGFHFDLPLNVTIGAVLIGGQR